MVDQDVFTVDPEDIHRTRVLQTWFAGRPVHTAEIRARQRRRITFDVTPRNLGGEP